MAAPKGNKNAVKEKGRPPLFRTVKQLQDKIDSYFTEIEGEVRKIFTISGLAYHLGFESRQSFYDYEKRAAFSYTTKRARLRIEMTYEENLHDKNSVGSIFALKNMGWKDKTESDITIKDLPILPNITIK